MGIVRDLNLFFNSAVQDSRSSAFCSELCGRSDRHTLKFQIRHIIALATHGSVLWANPFLVLTSIKLRIQNLYLRSLLKPHLLFPSRIEQERYADSCLAESRYWLGGKNIELFDDSVFVEDEKRQFVNLIDKVKSIGQAILLFIPGVCLKALVWLEGGLETYKRNQLIHDYLNKQQDFADQFIEEVELFKLA